MKICPKCSRKYSNSISVCKHCSIDLLEYTDQIINPQDIKPTPFLSLNIFGAKVNPIFALIIGVILSRFGGIIGVLGSILLISSLFALIYGLIKRKSTK